MIACLVLLAAALSVGNDEFDRSAAEGAARITFARVRREIVADGPSGGVLRQAMLAEPTRFRTRAEAEAACRALYAEAADRQYQAACDDIRRQLALPADFAVGFSEADRAGLDGRFPQAFAAERGEAVAEQAKGLMSATRPTEAEFDAKDEATLRREMTERIVAEQKTPVFEENVSYISERIVDPVLARARAERKRQREYLMRARSDAVAPSRLAAELRERLEGNVAEHAKKDGVDAWGVFPSVLSDELPRAVARRTLERLVTQVENAKPEITVEEVLAVIDADPDAHIRQDASAKVFRERYAGSLVQEALEKAVAEAPEAEREEFRSFLADNTGAEAVAKAVDQVLRREVMPKWKAARVEAAVRQADRTWPTLGDGTWFPPAELADAMVARSDYAASVKAWRGLAGMEALAKAEGASRVMEEADARADFKVARAFELARSAIAAQNVIVDREHPLLLESLRKESSGFFRSKPDVKTVAECLAKMTETKWEESRRATLWPDGKEPANADVQHAALFPSVRRKIELLAKSILEELNQPQPEEKRPEEPPPEETPPEDPAPEEPPEEELAFTLEISRKGAAVSLRLLQGETPVYEKTLGPELAPFGAAMKEVSDKLGRDLLKLK